MTPLHDRSVRSRGPYLRNTQQTQWTNIHALIGFRNRTPSNQAARPTGWAIVNLPYTKFTIAEQSARVT
jgi:hypothetical protein